MTRLESENQPLTNDEYHILHLESERLLLIKELAKAKNTKEFVIAARLGSVAIDALNTTSNAYKKESVEKLRDNFVKNVRDEFV